MSNLREAAQQALEAWDNDETGTLDDQHGAMETLREALEQPEHPRRLTDDEIGQIWFEAKIPGLTESDARRLIRAAEEAK